MNITLVIPTHNRLEYTQKTIQRLLEDSKEAFDLYLWDNASTDGTVDYLESLHDPRIKGINLSKINEGQTAAMNWAWSQTSAELVGKLDNDCLPTPGWTRIFSRAHKDIPMLGSLAMWHFPRNEFDEKVAIKKIQSFGQHRIFRHPWTCGSGFIIKRDTFKKIGRWRCGKKIGTTSYFLKIAMAGYINGWYYPLVLQEHMDDPESVYSFFHKKKFDTAYGDSYGYNFAGIKDMKKYLDVRNKIINSLMNDPLEASYYSPLRRKMRKIVSYFQRA